MAVASNAVAVLEGKKNGDCRLEELRDGVQNFNEIGKVFEIIGRMWWERQFAWKILWFLDHGDIKKTKKQRDYYQVIELIN